MEQIITKNDIEQLGEEARKRDRIVQQALAGDSDSIELCKEIICNQRAEDGVRARRYTMQFRPAGWTSLPPGLEWELVEAPDPAIIASRWGLPQSQHRYGVFTTSRPLTDVELTDYQIRIV